MPKPISGPSGPRVNSQRDLFLGLVVQYRERLGLVVEVLVDYFSWHQGAEEVQVLVVGDPQHGPRKQHRVLETACRRRVQSHSFRPRHWSRARARI